MKYNILWICAFLLLVSTIQKMNFQKNIFMFWQTPIQEAPLTVKVSYEKLQIATKRDGWKLHLITANNIQNYLPDYGHFLYIVSRGHRKTVHEKSDILRIYLIEQHGGVWLDFSSVLFQNLDWLSNDELFDQLIINKVGTNIDDPDMLLIGEGWHQSPYSYYNTDNRLVSEEYFGTALHFFAAKRKSRIMQAWKSKYNYLVTKSYQEMMPQIIQKRVYLRNVYQDGVYLSINVAFEHVIQQKQQQLDERIQLWDIFSKRQNVYEHFKIWQVHGQVGPIVITRFDRFHIAHLFGRTKQQVEQKTGKLWFYIKINNYWRHEVSSRQGLAQNYFRKYPSKTVGNIIKNGPTEEECKLYFIVKGSILHMLYQNSKYMDEIKTPFISIQQRAILRRYCTQKNWEMYGLTHVQQWSPIGQATKPQREIQYANMSSMWQKIYLIPIVYHIELKIAHQKWHEAWAAIIFYLTFRNLAILLKILFKSIKKRLLNRKNQPIIQLEDIKNYFKVQNLKTKILENFTKDNRMFLISWIGFNILGIGLLLGKGLAYTINQQFFEEIDSRGYLGSWTKLCLIICYNVILDWVIGKFINHKYANTFVSMQTILKETRILLYLPLGYVAVLHMYILSGFAHHLTMNFVAGGLLLNVWLQQVNRRQIGFSIFQKIELVFSNTKWAFLTLFLVYRLNRNLRYIRFNHHYAKQYLADILNGGFWVLFYCLTVSVLLYFTYKLFQIECNQIQKDRQTDLEREQRVLKRANIYHSLLMLVIIWLVVSKTSEIYQSKMASPFTYNFSSLFKILVGLYMLCGSLIRLSPSTKMFTVYGLLLAVYSFLPMIYWYYGEQFRAWFDSRPQIKQTCQNLMIIVFIVVELFRKKQYLNTENFGRKYMENFEEIQLQTEFSQKEFQLSKH